MKNILKIISLVCILVCCVLNFVLPCIASDAECKLTVNLENLNSQPVDKISVSISKIADIDSSGYVPAKGFENSGISIPGIVNDPSATNAETLLKFVKKNNISKISDITKAGKATFSSLETGIWLVFCEDEQEYYFNPYIVFLPYEQDGKLYYEISSNPKTKTNTPDNKSIYVIKKWEDKNNASKLRPESVTVYLRLNGAIVDTIDLNESNGWSHTFTNLATNGNYSVEEKSVDNYEAKYSGDSDNGFIITNTYNGSKLPQTGQLWWPVIIISIAGFCFVLLGIIELGVKKNEKKEK